MCEDLFNYFVKELVSLLNLFNEFVDYYTDILTTSLTSVDDFFEEEILYTEKLTRPKVYAQSLRKIKKEKRDLYNCYYVQPKHLPYMRRNY